MANLIAVIIGYLIGCFSTSVIVGKLWSNIDIRNYGSGNAGSTNVLRTLGFKAALVTFLGDCLKAILAVYIGRRIGGDISAIYGGLGAIIGHNWPVFFQFKGGKGIASTIGVIISINFILGIIVILIGIAVVLKTRFVSLGSLVAVSLLPIMMLIVGEGREYIILTLIIALMAILRHSSNIKRLINGTESKVGQKTRVK